MKHYAAFPYLRPRGSRAIGGALLLLAVVMLGQPAWSASCPAPPLSESAADMDALYAVNDYAFLARVERLREPGVLAAEDVQAAVDLFVYKPTLKGSLPATLTFSLDVPCHPEFTEGAVYLIFSNDWSETPLRAEARLVLASETGPGVEWLLEWVGSRHRAEAALGSLDALRWEHRILIARLGDASIDALRELQLHADDIRERDLLWWLSVDDVLHSNYPGRLTAELEERLVEETAPESAVTLIGKDGAVKLEARSLDLERIFARIDSMPMRRSEAQRLP